MNQDNDTNRDTSLRVKVSTKAKLENLDFAKKSMSFDDILNKMIEICNRKRGR